MVTGNIGVSKTATMQHVALEMKEIGYDVIPVDDPYFIIRYHSPSKRVLFVFDDCCGISTLSRIRLQQWRDYIAKIKIILKKGKSKTKILLGSRLQITKDARFKELSILHSCVCDLNANDICLTRIEKYKLAIFYLGADARQIPHDSFSLDMFPLLCTECSQRQAISIQQFFKNPFFVYEYELDKMLVEGDNVKYCALALCVIFNNCLQERWLIHPENEYLREIIDDLCEVSSVNRGLSRHMLRKELELLVHSYLRKESGIYRIIQDKMFGFFCWYFAKNMTKEFINHAAPSLISELFWLHKPSHGRSDDHMLKIVVPCGLKNQYIKRVIKDWSDGETLKMITNINLESPIFRAFLLVHLNSLSQEQQYQLANKRLQDTTILLQFCFIGDHDLVDWLLINDVNVNECNRNGISPLFIAAQEGYFGIVCKLLENKADINKSQDDGATPLLIACHRGHTRIVKHLVQNKANVNKSLQIGYSPLQVAILKGHHRMVKYLLDNNANVNLRKTYLGVVKTAADFAHEHGFYRIERMIHRTVPVSVNYILLFIITLCFYLALSLDMLILQFRMLYGGLKKVLKFIYRLLCICYNTLRNYP